MLGLLVFTVLGCGSPQDPDAGKNPSSGSSSTTSGILPPNEVVAMFADSIRRGDADSANKLITPLARQEISRLKMTISPPGSPDASYRIGEVRYIDEEKDAALVASMWIEPSEAGTKPVETEVVWSVRLESEGWRISGLAIDMGENVMPEIVDFEDLEAAMNQETQPQDKVANTQPNATPNSNLGAPASVNGTAAMPAVNLDASAGSPAFNPNPSGFAPIGPGAGTASGEAPSFPAIASPQTTPPNGNRF
jgi:hypothetical protein